MISHNDHGKSRTGLDTDNKLLLYSLPNISNSRNVDGDKDCPFVLFKYLITCCQVFGLSCFK